jgi:hypothetical protein
MLVGSNPASRSGSPTPRFRSEYGAAAGTGDYRSGSSGPLPQLTAKQRHQAMSARTASSNQLLMPAARNLDIPGGIADTFGSVSLRNNGGAMGGILCEGSPGQSESGSVPLHVLGGEDGGGVNSPLSSVAKSVLPRSTTPPGPSTPGQSTGFTIRQETVLRLLSAPSDKVRQYLGLICLLCMLPGRWSNIL